MTTQPGFWREVTLFRLLSRFSPVFQKPVSGPVIPSLSTFCFKSVQQTEKKKMQITSLNKTEPPGSDEWSTTGLRYIDVDVSFLVFPFVSYLSVLSIYQSFGIHVKYRSHRRTFTPVPQKIVCCEFPDRSYMCSQAFLIKIAKGTYLVTNI